MLSRLSPKLKALLQILLIIGIWFASTLLVDTLKLPLPIGIVGLLLTFLLLLWRLLPLGWIKPGADWLLAEMLLFFVPGCISIIKYEGLFARYGLQIMLLIVLGTVIVMTATSLAVDLAFRYERMARIRKAGRQLRT